MIGRAIDTLTVMESAEISRRATEDDIRGFVRAVGDGNPLHSDSAFAAMMPLGGLIAPGIWTAGLLSAVIGTRLPGPGSVYLSQELRFVKPVRPGDVITARVEVREVIRPRNRIRLGTTCRNQRGEEVLVGEAWVLPPKSPVVYAEGAGGLGALAFWALLPLAWAARAWSLWATVGATALAACRPRPLA